MVTTVVTARRKSRGQRNSGPKSKKEACAGTDGLAGQRHGSQQPWEPDTA